jgi:hypothetical protein
MNLPDMFAVSPHARQSFASRDALFGQIEADVNRDGRAYYITQAYDRRGRPLHSFAIFATRGADNNLQVVILESTPSQRDHNQPRLIGILDKLNSSPDYHRLDIVNIIPDNPGDQLRIVRHGATGYNLPVDQIMITGNSGQE